MKYSSKKRKKPNSLTRGRKKISKSSKKRKKISKSSKKRKKTSKSSKKRKKTSKSSKKRKKTSKSSKKRRKTSKSSPKPTNMKLYNKVKSDAKRKFDSFPSAYASSWIVREYKKRGGKYSGSRKSRDSDLSNWFREEWINICKLPKKVPCGRKSAGRNSDYPYCRPSVMVNYRTPKLASELSKSELKRRCSRKRRIPSRRIY